jgi:hypothetical protein
MTPVPDNTTICGLSEPLFARRWPATAGLGTLLSGQAAISRAASSAVKRSTTGSTCAIHGGGWHEERITVGEDRTVIASGAVPGAGSSERKIKVTSGVSCLVPQALPLHRRACRGAEALTDAGRQPSRVSVGSPTRATSYRRVWSVPRAIVGIVASLLTRIPLERVKPPCVWHPDSGRDLLAVGIGPA